MKKISFKSIKLLLALLATALVYFGNAATVTSIADGNWNSTGTWDTGVPTVGDDVIINHNVTMDVDILVASAVGSVTINNDASSQLGSLTVGNFIVSTTGDFSLFGFSVGWGIVNLTENGIINAGGAFIFDKGGLSFSGGTINIGDYYSQIEGTMTTSATVNINISTGGTRNDDTNPSIFFGFNAIVTLNTSNVVIDLQNLNTGTAPEIFANDFTVNGAGGTITLEINNNSNISDDICYITSDAAFKTLEINLNNDIASGNSIECSTVNAGVEFVVEDLILSNSLMYTVPITHFAITNSLAVNIDGELTVNGNFTSTASIDLTVDGGLNSTGSLSILSNITGEGIVQGATYTLGPANEYFVYGVQPADGEKAAGGTWTGESDFDWFNSSNWGQGIPSQNTSVLIHTDYVSTGNWPEVNTNGQTAIARSVELDGNGANLLIGNDGIMTIQASGNSPNHGLFLIGEESDCVVSGGNLTVQRDITISTNAVLSVINEGIINVDRDVTVEPGGSLEVTGSNSQVIIGN